MNCSHLAFSLDFRNQCLNKYMYKKMAVNWNHFKLIYWEYSSSVCDRLILSIVLNCKTSKYRFVKDKVHFCDCGLLFDMDNYIHKSYKIRAVYKTGTLTNYNHNQHSGQSGYPRQSKEHNIFSAYKHTDPLPCPQIITYTSA